MADDAGFFDIYGFLRRNISRSQVAILIYHRVRFEDDFRSVHVISPDLFTQQIEFLCRNYEIISLEKLARSIQEKKNLPRKAVAITLDDGYADNYYNAFPVLAKNHVPAAIFLTTGH